MDGLNECVSPVIDSVSVLLYGTQTSECADKTLKWACNSGWEGHARKRFLSLWERLMDCQLNHLGRLVAGEIQQALQTKEITKKKLNDKGLSKCWWWQHGSLEENLTGRSASFKPGKSYVKSNKGIKGTHTHTKKKTRWTTPNTMNTCQCQAAV